MIQTILIQEGKIMKKFTQSLLMASLLSVGASAAEVGFYAGGGIALEMVPKDVDMGAALVIRGGMTLDSVFENFAVEAELSKSIVDPKYVSIKQNVTTFATYAVYRIDINEKIYVKPRFGLALPNVGDDTNSRNIAFSAGVGGAYTVMDHMDVYVDYTIISEGISNFGGGVEWHF